MSSQRIWTIDCYRYWSLLASNVNLIICNHTLIFFKGKYFFVLCPDWDLNLVSPPYAHLNHEPSLSSHALIIFPSLIYVSLILQLHNPCSCYKAFYIWHWRNRQICWILLSRFIMPAYWKQSTSNTLSNASWNDWSSCEQNQSSFRCT